MWTFFWYSQSHVSCQGFLIINSEISPSKWLLGVQFLYNQSENRILARTLITININLLIIINITLLVKAWRSERCHDLCGIRACWRRRPGLLPSRRQRNYHARYRRTSPASSATSVQALISKGGACNFTFWAQSVEISMACNNATVRLIFIQVWQVELQIYNRTKCRHRPNRPI